jgi:hypothetical protein
MHRAAASRRLRLDWRTACALPPRIAQTFMFQSLTIALHPFGWHMSENPLRCHLGEHVQDIDHGLSHTQCAVERTDLR